MQIMDSTTDSDSLCTKRGKDKHTGTLVYVLCGIIIRLLETVWICWCISQPTLSATSQDCYAGK